MRVSPENSQSYATAALTTGTEIGFPKSLVKPVTVARRPVSSSIHAYFPMTGESAWLSSSVAVTVSKSGSDEIPDIFTVL